MDTQRDSDYIRSALCRHIRVLGCYPELERFPLIDDAIANFQAPVSAIDRTGHKLYLFIDEYDNFANEVLVSRLQGADRYRDLVSGEGVLMCGFTVDELRGLPDRVADECDLPPGPGR